MAISLSRNADTVAIAEHVCIIEIIALYGRFTSPISGVTRLDYRDYIVELRNGSVSVSRTWFQVEKVLTIREFHGSEWKNNLSIFASLAKSFGKHELAIITETCRNLIRFLTDDFSSWNLPLRPRRFSSVLVSTVSRSYYNERPLSMLQENPLNRRFGNLNATMPTNCVIPWQLVLGRPARALNIVRLANLLINAAARFLSRSITFRVLDEAFCRASVKFATIAVSKTCRTGFVFLTGPSRLTASLLMPIRCLVFVVYESTNVRPLNGRSWSLHRFAIVPARHVR